MQTTTDLRLVDEAKCRLQKSNPQISDAQWLTWLAQVAARDGELVLQLDGCRAEYPRE